MSLPARYSATLSWLRASTASLAWSMAPLSLTWRRPFASTMAAAVLPLSTISVNTSLAMRPEIVPSAIRSMSPPSAAAETGEAAMVRPVRLSWPNSSEITQLAASLASRPAATCS